MADFPLGLSFDDVLLLPRLSAILPGDADISSQLVPGFDMKIPVLSAAMDTVSESELAIALAREGGLAVIHRNNPIDIQAAMVSRVKRFENAVIPNPVTVNKDMTLEEVHQIMMDQGYSGFPVVDANRKLEGIITGRDMRGVDDYQNVRVEDVMTPLPRLITAAPTTTIEEARHILYTHRIEKLPLVDEHGVLAGLITETDIQKRAMFADASKDEHGHLRCGAAVGVGPDYLDRAKALISAGADALFIDAATGHTTRVMDVVSNLRKLTDRPIVAGNVVTAEGAADLIKAGVQAIKVGVGPGSICTTRVISGVGMPQFTAIQEVASVARPAGVTVIADGGIKYSGDMTKAIAAGANVCMMGSIFAGCDESPGSFELFQGRKYKVYRGMGSIAAMENGSKDRYFQQDAKKLVPEGVEGRVAYKGSVEDTVFQLVGGIRSGMGYCGCPTIEDLKEKSKFVKISAAALRESHPHDIHITKEAPNYSIDE